MDRTIFKTVSGRLKPALIFVGAILILSLLGLAISPLIAGKAEVTTVTYSHQGKFDYKGYSTSGLFSSQAIQSNPPLFLEVIENMEILFSSSVAGQVDMKLVLQDRSGNWQKEIPFKMTGGESIVAAQLDLDEIFEVGDTISGELGTGGGSYLLKIIAEVETGGEPFVMVLEGDLSRSTLQWNEAGFNKAERGFPGTPDWRQGSFGYRVRLKENELFGPITIHRKTNLPTVGTVGSDFALFTNLVESVDISFDYRFNCDAQINSLEETVEVGMIMEEPGRWRKSFTLLKPTRKQGGFTVKMPLDIDKLREIAGDIDEQIGDRGGKAPEITINVRVHTVAKTSGGDIDEVFTQQLSGKIGGTIDWGVAAEGEAREKQLTSIRRGTISGKAAANAPSKVLKRSSLIGLGLSLPILCVLAFLYYYWRRKPELSLLEEELEKNRSKYKGLISEVVDFPEPKGEETVVDTSSMEALVNISNNSLKPILLKVEPNRHIYWVVDGLTRYRYIVKEKELSN